jgi:hypothetical protein
VTDTCAELARTHAEPVAGTAPTALGWLLIERSGAWGRTALLESRLDPAIGAALAEATAGLPVRPQLIRRPGVQPDPRPRTGYRVVLAHAGPTPWMEQVELDDDRALLDLDPAVCTAPQPPGIGQRSEQPLFLVCTHAKRDRCCATLGRPIADTLGALHGDAVWEVSHVGGHRFAGNLVVLPEGLVYGGLDVAGAVHTVAQHLRGRIDLTHLRGRSSLGRFEQAAEIHVRARFGLDALGACRVRGTDGSGDQVAALVDTPQGRWVVRLRRDASGIDRRLSCDSDEPEDPGTIRLLGMEPALG